MKSKTLMALGAAAVMLLAPFSASAAVDRVVVQTLGANSGQFIVNLSFLDGFNTIHEEQIQPSIMNPVPTDTASYLAAVKNWVADRAVALGYTITSDRIIISALTQADVDARVTTLAPKSDWTATSTQASFILNKPSLATVATSGSYNDLSSKPTIPTISSLSFASPSRTLNSAFQVSSTRASYVNYSVDIGTTVSLAGGAVGTVFLEYADDSGFTTNVTEVGRFVNGQTGTLVVGLTLTQTNTAQIQGIVPAGKYVRVRTANTTGTPTFTYRSGQEVLLASN